LSLGWGKKLKPSGAFADLKGGFPPAPQPTDVYLSADRLLTQVEIGEFVKRLAAVRGVASPLRPRVVGSLLPVPARTARLRRAAW
jgi:hypothetical protein